MDRDAIVAYTYQADVYCPSCIMTVVVGTYHGPFLGSAERGLTVIAKRMGIDRSDESTYDSWDFPKVCYRDMITDRDRCGRCGEEL